MAARWKRLTGATGKIDVNMEQVAYMRGAPNGLTEIVFSGLLDSVEVRETADEIHQMMTVPTGSHG
jgi:hypothetical protein